MREAALPGDVDKGPGPVQPHRIVAVAVAVISECGFRGGLKRRVRDQRPDLPQSEIADGRIVGDGLDPARIGAGVGLHQRHHARIAAVKPRPGTRGFPIVLVHLVALDRTAALEIGAVLKVELRPDLCLCHRLGPGDRDEKFRKPAHHATADEMGSEIAEELVPGLPVGGRGATLRQAGHRRDEPLVKLGPRVDQVLRKGQAPLLFRHAGRGVAAGIHLLLVDIVIGRERGPEKTEAPRD